MAGTRASGRRSFQIEMGGGAEGSVDCARSACTDIVLYWSSYLHGGVRPWRRWAALELACARGNLQCKVLEQCAKEIIKPRVVAQELFVEGRTDTKGSACEAMLELWSHS